MTQRNNNEPRLPDVYHPNAIDMNIEEVRQEALASLGLQGRTELTNQEAAQVGQAIAERLESLKENVNQQSE